MQKDSRLEKHLKKGQEILPNRNKQNFFKELTEQGKKDE